MKNSVEHCGSDTDSGNKKSLTKKKTCPIATCKGSFSKFPQLYLFVLVPLSQHTTKLKDLKMTNTSFSLKMK